MLESYHDDFKKCYKRSNAPDQRRTVRGDTVAQLEELTRGACVKGILPDGQVTIVDTLLIEAITSVAPSASVSQSGMKSLGCLP
ncbi:MAG: hypothetical protein ACC628_13005 [Pirellulaceae bacterium]